MLTILLAEAESGREPVWLNDKNNCDYKHSRKGGITESRNLYLMFQDKIIN